MFDLGGKTALVTGASGGIGGAIAEILHKQGATVAISGTRVEALQTLANKLGSRTHIMPCNLQDHEQVKKLVSDAEAKMGKVDILICNAGITRDGLSMRMKDEDWEDVIRVNLTSNFYLARASLKGMMKQRFGRIIFITSVVGTMGNAGQANYAASKAGLTGMAKSLAQEVASRGITVNTIAPGFIETAMTDKLTDDQKNRMLQAIPAGSFGKSEDVAAASLFLSSNESRYITGQTIHINGGMVMV